MGIMYRSKGNIDYPFEIRRVTGGQFRAYPRRQGGSDASAAGAVYLGQDDHGWFVDTGTTWTPDAAREAAAAWAEAHEAYLKTGRWSWNGPAEARHLGVVHKVCERFAFARDLALDRDVFLLRRFARLGCEFYPGQRVSYRVVVDHRGRGLQGREIDFH
jgi:hypothetical protein